MRGRVVLAVCLLLVGSLSPAWAAADYEGVVGLTFPVQPGVSYADDYHATRGDHFHRATDLFATTGSPVYAAKSGEIVWIPARGHPTAGYAIQVRGDDGLLYAYYHLQSYADGLRDGSRVTRGQVIGSVGDSGNAAGLPHLHFEIHDERVTDPYGTHRLNPYPSLRAAERRGDYAAATGARGSRAGRSSATLRQGDRGPAVLDWVRQLNATGADLPLIGVFGPNTHAATRAFQRSAGILVDGIVGPQTRAAMADRLATTTAAAVTDLLRRGDRGPAVLDWVRQLNATGADLPLIGIFGPNTHLATRAFQRSAGILVDGIVGPQTRAAMAARLDGGYLRQGDRGPAVLDWVRQLNATGADLPLIGIFGPNTHAATRAFQRSAGILVDGIVGPQTRAAMTARLR